jgi:hypothetical protein
MWMCAHINSAYNRTFLQKIWENKLCAENITFRIFICERAYYNMIEHKRPHTQYCAYNQKKKNNIFTRHNYTVFLFNYIFVSILCRWIFYCNSNSCTLSPLGANKWRADKSLNLLLFIVFFSRLQVFTKAKFIDKASFSFFVKVKAGFIFYRDESIYIRCICMYLCVFYCCWRKYLTKVILWIYLYRNFSFHFSNVEFPDRNSSLFLTNKPTPHKNLTIHMYMSTLNINMKMFMKQIITTKKKYIKNSI